MRYIIYGAGAIGGVIGARLAQAGQDVVLICRGQHLETIRAQGLRLQTPEEDVRLAIPAVSHPREIVFRSGDTVILTMKTQDTDRALAALEEVAGADVPVICCQNGVENERLAARRFSRVYAMLVAMPATFLTPGEVEGESVPISGVLDTGRYPHGLDTTIRQVASDISGAKMDARADGEIMRLKYTKLLSNLGNALQLVTGEYRGSDTFRRLLAGLRAEAIACYDAAGIAYAPETEYDAEVRSRYRLAPIAGKPRGGSSTWQSLQRGHTAVETDYLNGEIVLLGRLHGVPTPLNSTVRHLANKVAAAGQGLGGFTAEQVEALAGAAAV